MEGYSGQVEMTDPIEQSKGGVYGHVLRRGIHLGLSFIPFIYFEFGKDFANMVGLNLPQFVSAIIIALIIAEAIRLKFSITIFGQREYEAHQVSALGWGAIGIGLVILMAPAEEYIWPLILSLSLGDPLMGELRRKGFEDKQVMIYSTLAIAAIWMACWHFFATPLWLVPLMAPLCMISEWPRLRWIDDNATMVLIPLCAILLLDPFIGLL
ncbi:MAG: hypothetical protein HOL72_06110 [Euryarchaeota archaeon]|jgi:hypothetical protein|nr:hypothetical protein [Euryarchaeota archaeon]MBT5255320.1 hypothetical protein [Euryarchaeota archaeon]MDG1546293.1 hypothetical protein [Candidatus Poseidoniaceae archaeon]